MFAAGGGKKRCNQGISVDLTNNDKEENPSVICPQLGDPNSATSGNNINPYLAPSSNMSSVMAGSISRKWSIVVMNNLEVPGTHLKCGSVSPISLRSNNIPKVTPEASEEYIDQDSDL